MGGGQGFGITFPVELVVQFGEEFVHVVGVYFRWIMAGDSLTGIGSLVPSACCDQFPP
jgi:hypothetical protein